MAEPVSTGATTAAVGAVTLAGTVLGMEYDALLFGLFAGLLWLSRNNTAATRLSMFSQLALSVFIAGLLAQILAIAAVSYFDFAAKLDVDVLRRALAFGLGYAWHEVIPKLWGGILNKLGVSNE